MGDMNADLPIEAFAHIRDSFGVRTGAADTCIKALRAAFTWGKEQGFPSNSEVFRLERKHKQKGGALSWTDADVAKFLAFHGSGTMARRWYYLAETTAGRIGDTHLLGPKHEWSKNDRLYVRYQPGKASSLEVEVPLSWKFISEIADLPPDAPAYLLNEFGQPFKSSGSLGNRIRTWIIEAGLCEPVLDKSGQVVLDKNGKPKMRATRSQHGIRKRRAEKIAGGGGSVFDVMAHLSHSDPKTAAV